MIERRFIKIRNILLAVLVFNWLVALAKIIYGYVSRCSSMAADGFHSFSDGASNVIGIVGILIASRPADEEHPYGHRKYETLASIAISVLLFLISFNLAKAAVIRFIHPIVPEVTILSFTIMLFTITVNTIVFVYERKGSRKLESDVLFADSEHTRSDILISISVIFTLLAIRAGFPMIDTIVALAISILIAKSAVDILRASSRVLCDRIAVVSDKIRYIVMGIDGVKETHQIRTRGRMDDIHVDLHVLVDQSMDVEDAHHITEKIEERIKKTIKGVSDVIVHVEPGGVRP
ncbi:MAG: cation transporter [Candidatus Omnitrophota bacterium]|nr:MAG: cation transporter [Candidatus Omnitrophota bacterium]